MLNNVTIRTKMLIMVLISLAGLFIFATRDIANKTMNLRSLQTTRILTKFAVKSGSLVHELQKERGLTAGFLLTKGEKFREDLGRQRSDTDSQIKELALYSVTNRDNLEGVRQRLNTANALLETLTATRGSIDGLILDPKESLAMYTQIISSYLDVVAQITIMSMNPEITREAMAYHAFLSAKEQTGLERATLNGVFATNRFDEQTYERYVGIAAAQATFLDVFAKFASDFHLKSFLKKLNAPFYQQVEEMRSTALARRQTGDFGIQPESWFATISTMINVMKEMENLLATHMAEKADSLADAARLSLMLSVFTAGIAAAVSLLFGFVIMIGVTAPLKTMAGMLKDMTAGRGGLDSRLNTDCSDEIGEVSRCFNLFMDRIQSIILDLKSG